MYRSLPPWAKGLVERGQVSLASPTPLEIIHVTPGTERFQEVVDKMSGYNMDWLQPALIGAATVAIYITQDYKFRRRALPCVLAALTLSLWEPFRQNWIGLVLILLLSPAVFFMSTDSFIATKVQWGPAICLSPIRRPFLSLVAVFIIHLRMTESDQSAWAAAASANIVLIIRRMSHLDIGSIGFLVIFTPLRYLCERTLPRPSTPPMTLHQLLSSPDWPKSA